MEHLDSLGWHITQDPFHSRFQDIYFELFDMFQRGEITLELKGTLPEMADYLHSVRKLTYQVQRLKIAK